ncbi:SDR family oxidoreductase [Thermoplasma volcanium]|nr:SDR family oxidoreductase [Thermoplasma volcanium]
MTSSVIVSAASAGIGKGIVAVLLGYGYNITAFSRDESKLRALKEEMKLKFGREINTVVADLSVRSDLENVVSNHREKYGSIDNLVVNYGDPKVSSFIEISDEDWDYAISMMLKSTIYLTREALRDMIRTKHGSIVYVTSMTVREPIEGFSISASLRSAVISLAKTLTHEVSQNGIRVNTIAQGYFNTDRFRDIMKREIDSLSGMKRLAGEIPLRRVGEPEEIGELVEFLLSSRSSYINGANIPIDGGITKFPL